METAVMKMAVTETVVTETAVTETMRMMRNDENGGNGEGTISDDDMNWSGGICWMSLIMRRAGAYFVSCILSIY
jgi:hypothetical protein